MSKASSDIKLWVSVEELIELGGRIARPASQTKKRVHTHLMGNHASIFKGRGLDFEEVRQYTRGDDVRLIDWKVTARTQKPHTRVYSEEKERPTYIIADQCTDMCFASQGTLKSTQVAELGAMIAFTTLQRGDRVGGTIVADDGINHLKPVRSKKHVVHWCALLSQQSKVVLEKKRIVEQTSKLEEALHGLLGLAYHDANIFVLTTATKISQRCAEQLIRLAQKNKVIVFDFYDPLDDMNLPVPVPVTDGAYQYLHEPHKEFKLSNPFIHLFKMGVGHVQISTAKTTSSQVLNWLKQQNAR